MFASYEIATSFPSLTAIKGYDLDKSADVPLMGHYAEGARYAEFAKSVKAVNAWCFLSLPSHCYQDVDPF